jgi:hypothetical protein
MLKRTHVFKTTHMFIFQEHKLCDLY